MRDLDGSTVYEGWVGGKWVRRTVTPLYTGHYTAEVTVYGEIDEPPERYSATRVSRTSAIWGATGQWMLAQRKEAEERERLRELERDEYETMMDELDLPYERIEASG